MFIQRPRNLGGRATFHGIEAKHFIDNLYLLAGSGYQDDPVGHYALSLSGLKHELRFSILIDQQTPKAISRSPTLAKA
jgi:hypothetical protein